MTDAPDPQLALRAEGLLADFNRAGVLQAADVHVAQRLGRLSSEVDDRVLLAAALVVRSTRQGSVMLSLADAPRMAAALDAPVGDREPPTLPWPDPADWLDAVAGSPLVSRHDSDGRRPLRLHEGALWLDRYWRQEVGVAEDLLRRASSAPVIDTEQLRTVLARLWPGSTADDQRLAAAVCVLSRVAVLAGGPGTGKTTTVARLVATLHALAEPGAPLRLALAAPTGKAAARMKEAMQQAAETDSVLVPADRELLRGTTASTLHRLLGVRRGSTRFWHDRHNPLPLDVLVVDEASMVSLTLFARLLEALPPTARLVIVGDPGQLAAVEAGAVLADLTADAVSGGRTAVRTAQLRAAVPHDLAATVSVEEDSPAQRVRDGITFLRTVYRYDGDGRIAALADGIRDGDGERVLAVLRGRGDAVAFHEVADDGPLSGSTVTALRAELVDHANSVVEASRAGDAPAALEALDRHRLMCAHRRGPRGVAVWEQLAERWIAEDVGVVARRDGRYAGLPLIVLANDYDNGLFNGDTGVIVMRGNDFVAAFGTPDAPVEVPLGRLGSVAPLRALTVHRSQGSQFDHVTVLLPAPSSPLLSREMLYTAVTRARGAVTVVGSAAAVSSAVMQPVARATGLQRRLAGLQGTSADCPSADCTQWNE
ncbi:MULTISPECIES: exodeoxyribonuclease V subunit alpha [unclassified Modestobacter]|uniref:exodeoxyribonuclease V subunit alpha n=1 Tax=unclassified Modestobacter TaxID=2643866 RepID=UPI0022AA7970|nr:MULTISPECIES: exodeoxyribonuclease V subunit alpha [unclassified Modestobacter]MCZ2826037.1 exodeoxyribonuclease V subunit alpha [Modestobacter sp. VKM Ac-2981]MCZ2852898.1 exodeoxyribonuclease V subunit alpha [Modestobacter sp. VKM Ac-2982]